MFFDLDLRGDALPPQTLCLTYDDGPGRTDGDGPGPKTAELGDYLAGRGIAATFFVIGAEVRANPGIVARLRAGGHLVGNHTDTHPTLVSFLRDGGDVAGDLARADEAIGSPSAAGELTYFRAPYGDWRDDQDPADPWGEATISPVARALNADGRFPHLVGPVGWDVDAADWDCWRSGASAEECGQRYLDAIERQERGIVLLHDSSDSPAIRGGNLAYELTRWLVPILEARGYRFVRLDEVPGVASAGLVGRQATFQTDDGRYLTCPADSTRVGLTPAGTRPGGRERFGIVSLVAAEDEELVALRAGNGRFVMRTADGAVRAEGLTVADSTRWWLAHEVGGTSHSLRATRPAGTVPADEGIATTGAPGEVRLGPDPIPFRVAPVASDHPTRPPPRKPD